VAAYWIFVSNVLLQIKIDYLAEIIIIRVTVMVYLIFGSCSIVIGGVDSQA
jgi:hypothetical protein